MKKQCTLLAVSFISICHLFPISIGTNILHGQNTGTSPAVGNIYNDINTSEVRECGTTEYLEFQKQRDPELESRMAKIEADIQAVIKNPPPTTYTIVYIPVVFHVVYNTAAGNIDDSYIQRQMDRLNQDFHKLNSDWTKTPSVYQPLVADCEIQFCLASKDPNGNPTNGIIRKSTTVTEFTTNDDVKYTSKGGDDIWDRNKYLNIWVCRLAGYTLGYSSTPGYPAATDGVVIIYPGLPPPNPYGQYDMGRTATHEVGHFFNLKHVWGDANCGDDKVDDTPTQEKYNGGCVTFPHVTCSNGPSGDMYMNFMDYSYDNCTVMFTKGQKDRMWATLNGTRSSLLTSAATKCSAAGTNDFSLEDHLSIYPNPSNGKITVQLEYLRGQIAESEIEIYNVFGEKVYGFPTPKSAGNNTLQGEGKTIDLSSQIAGIYILQMKTDKGKVVRKIILSK